MALKAFVFVVIQVKLISPFLSFYCYCYPVECFKCRHPMQKMRAYFYATIF